MAYGSPSLDDLRFDDLMNRLQQRLPLLYPEWSDQNPSDPGIMVLEVLAWLTEMLLFQVDQLPEHTVRTFLNILANDPKAIAKLPLPDATALVLSRLRQCDRAVTSDDFEQVTRDKAIVEYETQQRLIRTALVEAPAPATFTLVLRERGQAPAVRRVLRVVSDTVYDELPPTYGKLPPALIHRVFVVPEIAQADEATIEQAWAAVFAQDSSAEAKAKLDALHDMFRAHLAERVLLASRFALLRPTFVWVGIEATVVAVEHADPAEIRRSVHEQLLHELHPLLGGPDGLGSPIGGGLYVSSIVATLSAVKGVDYVQDLAFRDSFGKHRRDLDIPSTALVRPLITVNVVPASGAPTTWSPQVGIQIDILLKDPPGDDDAAKQALRDTQTHVSELLASFFEQSTQAVAQGPFSFTADTISTLLAPVAPKFDAKNTKIYLYRDGEKVIQGELKFDKGALIRWGQLVVAHRTQAWELNYPELVPVAIAFTIDEDNKQEATARATKYAPRYFNPLIGGADRRGWVDGGGWNPSSVRADVEADFSADEVLQHATEIHVKINGEVVDDVVILDREQTPRLVSTGIVEVKVR
jgi:hypothetical protein